LKLDSLKLKRMSYMRGKGEREGKVRLGSNPLLFHIL
jgi:hypothetical protein